MRKGGRRGGRRTRPTAEINITNLIDVTMTLLIVFMIVAPLLKQGLEIDLPDAEFVEGIQTEEQVILVEYDKQGIIHINQTEVVPGRVTEKIQELVAEWGEVPVHIRADQDLSYGEVVGIYGEILKAGVKSIDVEAERLDIGQ
jgi:biopolymer transport protein TolR